MQSYLGVLPAGWLTVGGLSGLLLGTYPAARRYLLWWSLAFSIGGIALGVYLSYAFPVPHSGFFGILWGGGIYALTSAGIALIATLAIGFLHEYLLYFSEGKGWEALPLTLILAAALTCLPASNHMILSIVALETVSIGGYILVALAWSDRFAPEAGVKYLLLSAFSFAVLLMGLSYLYGMSGSLYFHHLRAIRWEAWQNSPLFVLSLSLIAMGILFKLSVFPFHWWAPDVYGGATPGATGIIVSFGKLNGTILAAQILHVIRVPEVWLLGIAGIAAASSLYGNLLALTQNTLQRALAYSSVAHGGYILLALVSGPEGRLQAWVYALAYGLMSTITFGLLALRAEPLEYKTLRGLGHRRPAYAMALAVGLASLSGMPPFIGFFAKYAVFTAAFKAGFVIPAIVAILSALLGYFYYWRPIAWMYQRGEGVMPVRAVLAMGAIILLLLGIVPALLWGWMDYLYGLAGFFQGSF